MTKSGGLIIGACLIILVLAQVFLAGLKYDKLVFNRVVDGDTFWVTNLRDGSEWKVRLWGVDAPEQKECYFDESKEILNGILIGKQLFFEKMGRDDYGRILAKVFVGKESLEEMLVATGAARVFDASLVHDELKPSEEYLKSLRSFEVSAKEKGLGIWSRTCRRL